MDQEVLTEVPQSMTRLIRLVTRGFYSIEHALVIDMLVRNPCMKEDDMLELLKFDRKQLRAVTNTLKMDKFIKTRMRVETDSEGRTTKHNYYFISYIMFVNVVKYKLDHVRKKIEMEERDNTSRASFRCEPCQKTFTDLEVHQLFDFNSHTFRAEVIEDTSAVNKTNARTLLAKFNEQIQVLYDLLRECEDVKLAPELLEPEPTDLKSSQRSRNPKTTQDGDKWSGDATKNKLFGYSESSVTVSLNEEQKHDKEGPRQQPVWMTHSTVDGVPVEAPSYDSSGNTIVKKEISGKPDVNREIENLLMIHEKKGSTIRALIPVSGELQHSESSDSDAEISRTVMQSEAVVEMESEDEEEAVMVIVAGQRVALSDVTEEMVSRMSLDEKDTYIRLGKEMYHKMYE